MAYDFEDWKRCKKCGSYMPSDWIRCGRCGYSPHEKQGGRLTGWLILLALIFAVFIFRNELLSLIPQSVKENLGPVAHGISPAPNDPSVPGNDRESSSGKTGGDSPGISEGDPYVGGIRPQSPPGTNGSAGNSGAAEEEIAEIIRKTLRNAENSVKLPILGTDDDPEAIFNIIEKMVMDDPEIMFYAGCTYRSDGQLTIEYSKPAAFIPDAAVKVSRKADEIVSAIIRPGMSDYEKELAIHDYLVNSCRYDVENFERDSVPPEGNEAYGPLIEGKAVCGGYAKAMKLLLSRAGVECLVVTGISKGERHAWNMVNISGRYYHVDATWDDPVMDGGKQVLNHTYFNLTDSDIRTDHEWEESDYPRCTSLTHNYHHYNGLTVSSEDEFAELMKSAVDTGSDSMTARFVNGPSRRMDIEDILKRTATSLRIRRISYSINEDYGAVYVWFR